MTNSKPPRNPLTTLWNILSTIGGILALSNMTSTWLQDLHAWKGFLLEILTAYRAVVEPISRFLFGWLPFEMWVWLGDYLLFGLILMSSYIRGVKSVMGVVVPFGLRRKLVYSRMVALWPLHLYRLLKRWVKRMDRKDPLVGNVTYIMTQNTLQWLGAILLGMIVLFSINAAL